MKVNWKTGVLVFVVLAVGVVLALWGAGVFTRRTAPAPHLVGPHGTEQHKLGPHGTAPMMGPDGMEKHMVGPHGTKQIFGPDGMQQPSSADDPSWGPF
jgi:hypothetical protein